VKLPTAIRYSGNGSAIFETAPETTTETLCETKNGTTIEAKKEK
jgi:hypothetical protein